MSTLFSALVGRLQTYVPIHNSVPSDAQYAQAIRDAVADFNVVATRVKRTTLQITAGTDTYAMPADFMKFVGLGGFSIRGTSIVTPEGIIPTGPMWGSGWGGAWGSTYGPEWGYPGGNPLTYDQRERYWIEGNDLKIHPVPVYSLKRTLTYGAGYIETDVAGSNPADTEYIEMTEIEARIILLYAQSIAWGYKAGAVTGGLTASQVGDVRVQKSSSVSDWKTTAVNLEQQYRAAVDQYVGTPLSRG
jgi:hypothetical protein